MSLNKAFTLLKRIFLYGIVLLTVGLTLGGNPVYAVQTLSFQGQISSPQGAPLTGSHAMTFSLYSTATGGTPIWTESYTGINSIPFINGYFSVGLGSLTTLSQTVFDTYPLYLGISVDSAAELLPRTVFQSVPFAMTAAKANDSAALGGHAASDFVLIGGVIPTLQINTLTANSMTAQNMLYAANATFVSTVNASNIVANGSRITSLNASEIKSGVLPLRYGGTGATTSVQARLNLGIDLSNLSVGNLTATGTIYANQVEVYKNGRYTPLGALAFKNKITSADILELDTFQESLGFGGYLPRTGGLMTGTLTLNNVPLTIKNAAGTVITLNARGDIEANQVTAETLITTRELSILNNGIYKSLGQLAFIDKISSANFASLSQFKQDLGLGSLAFIDRLTSANLAIADLSQALDLKALAHKSTLLASDINIEGLSQALNLGVLAHINRVEPQHVNTANLATALGLGRLAYKNTITAEDINTRNIATALRLGNLAFLNKVRGEDISTASVSQALKLGAIAHLSLVQPQHLNISALTSSLNLSALAYLNQLEPRHLNIPALAVSLNLGTLSHLDSITTANFTNLATFKSQGLGLRALAYKDRITANDFENLESFKRNTLQLGRLATQNTITASDVQDLALFKEGLGLRSLAYKSTVSTSDIENYPVFLKALKSGLQLGSLSTLNVVNRSHFEDFDQFKADMGMNLFVNKQTGDRISGSITIEQGSIEILKADSNIATRLSADGITTSTLNVQDAFFSGTLSGTLLEAQQAVYTPRVIPPSATQDLLLGSRTATLNISAAGGIHFQSLSNNEFKISDSEILAVTNGGQKYFKLSNNGHYFGSSNKQNGALDIGYIDSADIQPYVFLGYEGKAELLLDARTNGQEQAFFGFPETGDALSFTNGNVLLGNEQNAIVEIKGSGQIFLKNQAGYIGLKADGTLALAAVTRESLVHPFLSQAGGTVTGNLTINNGNLIIKDQNNVKVASIDTSGVGTFSTLYANSLEANSISQTGQGKIGELAFYDHISTRNFEDFDEFIEQNLSLSRLLKRNGDTVMGELIFENAPIMMMNDKNMITSILNPDGSLWVTSLKLGETPETATDIFENLKLKTLEVATFNIRGDLKAARLKIGNNFDLTPQGELKLARGVLIGPDLIPAEPNDAIRRLLIKNPSGPQISFETTATKSAVYFQNIESTIQRGEIIFTGTNATGLFQIKAPRIMIESPGGSSFVQSQDITQLISNEIVLKSGKNEITLAQGGFRVSANAIIYAGGVSINGTITANAFAGNGSALTNLNASNITTGILGVANGGTGVSSLTEARALFALDARNMTVDTLIATRSITASILRGPLSGSIRRITIDSNVSFNRAISTTSTANFYGQTTFEGPVSFRNTATFTATSNFRNDVIIKSRGNANSASLHVVNTVNKNPNSDEMISNSGSVVGGTAFIAESFGRAPTVVAYHYSPAGYAFTAVKGDPSAADFNQANLYALGEGSGAIQVINYHDGHAIVAVNKSDTNQATIKAVNEGSGQALTASTRGTLPAIAAYSMGDTAILAMGDIKMSSSRRWKKEIKPLDSSLEKVLKLRGVSYIRTDKNTQKRNIGFIAEEVGQIYPELVDYEANGVDAKSVAYGNITAILVEALKEENHKVQNLQTQLEELKKENADLSTMYDQFQKDIAELKAQSH